MKFFLGLVALFAVFWAVTLWRAAANEARAEARFPPLGRMIDVGGTPVHVLQQGAGPDIVLIHGASGNLRDFTFDLAGRLTDRYRVTMIDRPGLGHTAVDTTHAASIFDQADLLVGTAAALDLDRPLVLGHSYGGAVALAWATRHPGTLSGLVLLAAASNPWDTPLSLFYRILSHPVGGAILAPILTAWVPDRVLERSIAGVFDPQPMPDGYAGYIGAELALRRASLRENARQRATIEDEVRAMVPDYARVDIPAEILHGTADLTVWLSVHSEPLAGQLPDGNLVAMDGIGHAPHHSDPAAVTAAIDRAAARAQLR